MTDRWRPAGIPRKFAEDVRMDASLLLRQITTGYWGSQALYVAAKLGLADQLVDGPRSCDDLAIAVGAKADVLYRLLRALASLGIFTEVSDRQFALTPAAELLRSGTTESMRHLVIMFGEEHYVAWGELLHSVQTGENAFEHHYGAPVFAYYAQHPAPAAIFNGAMSDISRQDTAAVIAAYDFQGIRCLVDVGGGHGQLLTQILAAYPELTGILFDQPAVVAGADSVLADWSDRIQISGGDFFEAVPTGGDAYLLKHIIHDWDDADSRKILANCRQVMQPGDRLLLVEQVVQPGNTINVAKWLDLNMLVMTQGGRERTQSEFATLLSESGFQLKQIHTTASEVCIIESRAT
ncbi:acetylserotonin O-methyltransferase [Synechococcus elongatus]|uniref:Methyltransferase n=1 Tax=Synechococcus elongatus PCC 11802 TaxID=2283154 RepID=A0AAT9JWG7_SYNEL|nr:acetylserotonin O-methyltransferase [Synechococcus elongatus]